MQPVIDFSIGLTEGVAWPWPIAVYLFLAGISGGALATALMIRLYRKQTTYTPLLKAASLIAFSTIALGMVCLVLDLTKPLYFWRILIYYNPHSVMSLGVMALLVYIPVTAALTVLTLRSDMKRVGILRALLDPLEGILQTVERVMPLICWVGLVFALTICAYTGFLISMLIRFPLINTAVLPALFVASGLSAGAAFAKLVAVSLFRESRHSEDMHVLHLTEWPVMAAEALCIFMIAVSLFSGSAAAQEASKAFVSGMWATEFWLGVVIVGFATPLILNFLRQSAVTFFAAATASVVGMMCLRLFILYAGQMNSFV